MGFDFRTPGEDFVDEDVGKFGRDVADDLSFTLFGVAVVVSFEAVRGRQMFVELDFGEEFILCVFGSGVAHGEKNGSSVGGILIDKVGDACVKRLDSASIARVFKKTCDGPCRSIV